MDENESITWRLEWMMEWDFKFYWKFKFRLTSLKIQLRSCRKFNEFTGIHVHDNKSSTRRRIEYSKRRGDATRQQQRKRQRWISAARWKPRKSVPPSPKKIPKLDFKMSACVNGWTRNVHGEKSVGFGYKFALKVTFFNLQNLGPGRKVSCLFVSCSWEKICR